jgi:hypothetical protein
MPWRPQWSRSEALVDESIKRWAAADGIGGRETEALGFGRAQFGSGDIVEG